MICCFIWEKMAKKSVTYLLKTKTTKSKFCVWGRNKHICFSPDPKQYIVLIISILLLYNSLIR